MSTSLGTRLGFGSLSWLVFSALNHIRVVGDPRRLAPRGRNVLICCNHLCHLDAGVPGRILLRETGFRENIQGRVLAAKDVYYRTPVWRAFSTGVLRLLPVERGGGADQTGLQAAIGLLRNREEGRFLIAFPEGTRSRDGTFGRPRRGVGRIALGSGAEVIPCFLRGTESVLGVGVPLTRLGKGHEVLLVIGSPLSLEDLQPGTPADWDSASERILNAIVELGAANGQVTTTAVSPTSAIQPPWARASYLRWGQRILRAK